MKISKEGRVIIPVLLLVLCGLATGFIFLTFWALPPVLKPELRWVVIAVWGSGVPITWGFVIAFFRLPMHRPLLADDEVIFAPCDGKVVVTEEVHEGEVSGEIRRQVSIFMSMTDVHLNWFPVGGRVGYFKHHSGAHFVAWHPKSSDRNEHTTIAVETPSYGTVVFRQIAGTVARRIVSYTSSGAQAVQNTPCGFIKFGSRVDLFLPLDAELLVSLGQKVRGGQTPIAKFTRCEPHAGFRLSGTVVEGSRRGRTLGYPTANIAIDGVPDVVDGVYAARVCADTGDCYNAMANLGVKPTFPSSDRHRTLELHLLDFDGDLYGRTITAELTEFIRPERRFDSAEELRAQIEKDKTKIESILCI